MNKRIILFLFLIFCLMPLPRAHAKRKLQPPPVVEHDGRIVTEVETIPDIDWTEEEKSKPVAARLFRKTDDASFFAVRLQGQEKPHIHETHDLTVFILKGSVKMHIGRREELVARGDVIEIPRNTPHWAENLNPKEPSLAYVVFTPPLNGEDFKLVEERSKGGL